MSYDFDTRLAPCDHLQLRERMMISTSDFRTLVFAARPGERMRAPITALGATRLFISGVEVPPDHAVYGWTILKDELSVAPDQKSKIVFRNPVRLTNLVIEVQYITSAAYCLKCSGYSKTNDYKVSKSGSFIHVVEVNKLIHRITKFLLTSTCVFYPTFTSRLKDYVGRKFGVSLTEDDIMYECSTALDNLKQIQLAQKNVQFLAPQEILRDVESLSTTSDPTEPCLVITKMQVSAYGVPHPVPLTFAIRTNKN